MLTTQVSPLPNSAGSVSLFVFSTDTAGVPFSRIVFQELLHIGAFKTVHRAIINCPPIGQEVAVKRLKGTLENKVLVDRLLNVEPT